MAEYANNDDEQKHKRGALWVVSTPIGNKDDITFRAVRVLRSCDAVICEEAKIGARILHQYNVTQKMELLNEQNEDEKTPEYISMLFAGKDLALISDCGTPVFADPGLKLVQSALKNAIPVHVVPGPTSIMTALVRSGFPLNRFYYAGFLSREKEERFAELKKLREEPNTVVLLETPYRLNPVLEAAAKVMPERSAYIGCNLTMHFETHHYGTFQELFQKFKELRFKGEFVLVFEGANNDRPRYEERRYEKSYSKPDGYRRDDRRDGRSDGRRDDRRDSRSDDRRDFRRDDRRDDKRDGRSDDRRDFRRDDRRDSRSDDRRDFRREDKREGRGGEWKSGGQGGGNKPRGMKPRIKTGYKKPFKKDDNVEGE